MAPQNKSRKQDEPEGISWAPDDQEAGGGLLSDVDVDFTEVECIEWDYDGKVENPVPALHVHCKTDDGTEADLYLSAGSLDKIVPSEDGSTFVPAEGSSSRGVPASSNAGIFMRSMSDAGFPFSHDEGLPDEYDPRNIKQLIEGGNYHILRVPQPKRPGVAEPEGKKAKYPREVPTVTKVNRHPWEKASKTASGGKGKVAGSIKPKGKQQEEEDDEATAAAVEVLTELLQSKKYAKSGINVEDDLYDAVFTATKQRQDRKAIIAAIQQEGFLDREEFTVDDGVLTLA